MVVTLVVGKQASQSPLMRRLPGTTSSGAEPSPAGYCFARDRERVRVVCGAAPAVVQHRHIGAAEPPGGLLALADHWIMWPALAPTGPAAPRMSTHGDISREFP
jgi:hypothetical protein